MSPRAKAKIRQWFAKERREEALESGKDAIVKEVRRGGLPIQRLMNAESMAAIAGNCATPTSAACTRRSARTMSRPGTSSTGWLRSSAASTTLWTRSPNGRTVDAADPCRRGGDAGHRVRHRERGDKLAKCCTRSPATRSWGS